MTPTGRHAKHASPQANRHNANHEPEPVPVEWGTIFPDPRLAAAIVDRVTFKATILETGTQSYRLRTTKTTTRTPKPS